MKLRLTKLIALLSVLALASPLAAADHRFAIDETEHGAKISVDGEPFAEYVVDQANKTYLFPVYGPSGTLMARQYPMKTVEGEQHDHPHHRGICFGHENINGSDSWAEHATFDRGEKTNDGQKKRLAALGRIEHVRFVEKKADSEHAVLTAENRFVGHDGAPTLTEFRTMTFLVEDGARLIDIDQRFVATEGDVTFGDRKDAGLSIRVPSVIAVSENKGGHIANSEGQRDGECWGKRARWVDYHGPIDGQIVGVAFFNHPQSFRHPTTWHVRTYGLFTANAFGTLDKSDPNGEHKLAKGEELHLHHRFVLHNGDEKEAKIAAAHERYAKMKKD
ncbi:MAG: PmoA family protein [Planctomycetales bacterium]|nr:PmoA family protein [Planctomycetales bacterium]